MASSTADTMKDEYGTMDSAGLTFSVPTYKLECGVTLRDVEVRYKTFGTLAPTRDNIMVVCHALTGNAALDSWWGDMLGPDLLFDTAKYFVVCANILGSCYGTTGPTSICPDTGRPYGPSFPDVTMRDSVGLHIKLVKEEIAATSVACVIGGSLGGMQTLEWGIMAGPSFVRAIVPMCCGAYHHAWQIAISEAQRQAIYADPRWANGNYTRNDPPLQGLAVARQFAMVSYRSHAAYSDKFGREQVVVKSSSPSGGGGTSPKSLSATSTDRRILSTHNGRVDGDGAAAAPVVAAGLRSQRTDGTLDCKSNETTRDVDDCPAVGYEVERYLQYQGKKFGARFDPLSYVKCTRLMDTHDVGRGRGGVEQALKKLGIPCLIIAVHSDGLYPVAEQKELHSLIPGSKLHVVYSDNGHDGFLLDQFEIMPVAKSFLDENVMPSRPSL